MVTDDIKRDIRLVSEHIEILDKKKDALVQQLSLLQEKLAQVEEKQRAMSVNSFSAEQKIQIFMGLFLGREDVFPRRWNNSKTGKSGYAPACHNEWVKGICNKPQVKCSECPNQAFIPVTEDSIRKHLAGDRTVSYRQDYTIGLYPMLQDETCWFLAADFDKEHWRRDVAAFLDTCKRRNVPASLERSRSGNGGHVWIFFHDPVAASEARKMGAVLLTETMERCPEIGFESYDRFFPNQDTMPAGGFGNLIALPLQKMPREKGNSVFLDKNFDPYPDQWEYLASVRRMLPSEVSALVEDAASRGRILGVRMPLDEDDERPWDMRPSGMVPEIATADTLPQSVELVLGNQLFIPKQGLPPVVINRLIRLAAFQNPEFYIAQSMRLSTFGKPRIIACAEDFSKHIGLPRGCIDGAIELFKSLNIEAKIDDKRNSGQAINTKFLGELTHEQKNAARALLKHDTGVLAATTAFGKTVVAANVIAARKTNTLILVHRRQLLEQWVERLKTFLDISEKQIGIVGGGKRKAASVIDVAVIQGLVRKNAVSDIIADYGHLIVDECHHLSAVSFEAVARAFKGKYVLGLTATTTRKDGHHPIIFMQCGPVRYKVDAREQAALRPFTHQVMVRHTEFHTVLPEERKHPITRLYTNIAADDARNQMIFEDVLRALEARRNPLVLTERKSHAVALAEKFSKFCKHVVVMTGGQNAKQRNFVKEQLATITEHEERLLVATGRYIGEGFDDSCLDTLFLAMPISWHGTLAQYAGRLHRLHHAKKEVIIYDYVDRHIPVFVRMAEKRMKGYERLGYSLVKESQISKPFI